tara:strand:+ start:8342 stop:9160 length:819 start_codon:yes stop_codon:yes gene_type:complete
MNKKDLVKQIKKKQSFLCVGLDTDLSKIPNHLHAYDDPVFEFNKKIIDATKDYCVAYKPNIAFYECMGSKGWESLQKTLNYIPKSIFTIADAKRGDIGNTSAMYARTFFENMNFDSVTVTPYMGSDSVLPFLNYKNKWVILLVLTSNEGSKDFQYNVDKQENKLYENIIYKSSNWGSTNNLMYVVGATQLSEMRKIRQIAPKNFLLIPGVGAQGGDLVSVSRITMNSECGILINCSRSIIYSSDGLDFAEKASSEAKKIQQKMSSLLLEMVL